MWRQAISRIISGGAGKSVNRELSAKTAALKCKNSSQGGTSKGPCPDKKKQPCPEPLGPKNKSPCAGVVAHDSLAKKATNIAKLPIPSLPETTPPLYPAPIKKTQPYPESKGQKKKSPCAGVITHDSLAKKASSSAKLPTQSLPKTAPSYPTPSWNAPSEPCPPKSTSESPCKKGQPKHTSKDHSDNCAQHEELVPPMSVLCLLKGFELKSECTSFHMLTSGHDCCE